jgi:hypothetical protein
VSRPRGRLERDALLMLRQREHDDAVRAERDGCWRKHGRADERAPMAAIHSRSSRSGRKEAAARSFGARPRHVGALAVAPLANHRALARAPERSEISFARGYFAPSSGSRALAADWQTPERPVLAHLLAVCVSCGWFGAVPDMTPHVFSMARTHGGSRPDGARLRSSARGRCRAGSRRGGPTRCAATIHCASACDCSTRCATTIHCASACDCSTRCATIRCAIASGGSTRCAIASGGSTRCASVCWA